MSIASSRLVAENGSPLAQQGGGHILAENSAASVGVLGTQLGLEYIEAPYLTKARASQIGMEVAFAISPSKARASQVGVEFAVPNTFSVVVTPAGLRTIVGRPVQYRARLVNDDGTQSRSVNVAWSCDSGAGSIDASGIFMPTTTGIHTITATETS